MQEFFLGFLCMGMCANMISQWIDTFNIKIKRYQAQPGDIVYRVKDLFTTRDGSWEPSGIPGSVPQWARDRYLKPFGAPDYFDDAGTAMNLFGAIWENGRLVPNIPIHFWTHTDNSNHNTQKTKRSGWANMSLFPSSSYVPERGETGAWSWTPEQVKADVVVGGGLPQRWHVSTFAAWEKTVEPAVELPPIEDKELLKRITMLEVVVARHERTFTALNQLIAKQEALLSQWTVE